ncbi:hypothetical protein KY285_030973 [Solanum tuberosum]|nr:hypothetical protein KY285_030973 [Solanum tuberosum]
MRSIATEDEVCCAIWTEVTVEVRDASPGHYLLKIESFSLLSESGIDKKMIIYPDGNTDENGSGHISVYLAISGTTSLPANWEEKCGTFNLSSLYGDFPNLFISHNTFKEASNGYLVDDKCVLGAEIFIVQRQAIEFTVGGYKWKLSLYPKGNANNKGCDISIFLKSVDAKDFDHHEKVKLCDQKKGYLVNDCIVVEVELKVEFKHSVKSLEVNTQRGSMLLEKLSMPILYPISIYFCDWMNDYFS